MHNSGALKRGWLFFLLGVALARGLLYAFLVSPWQAPDEPGHYEYARTLAAGCPAGDRSLPNTALQAEIIGNLARHNFWEYTRRPQPQPLPVRFADDPLLARSGSQLRDEPPAYYVPLALLYRLLAGLDVTAQLRLGRLYSLLLTLGTVLVAWAFTRDALFDYPAAQVATVALVALQPMAGFIGAALNNDVLAMLLSSLALWALWRLVRQGGKMQLLAASLLVGLALAAKKTNAFLLPLPPLAWTLSRWPWSVSRATGRRVGAALSVAVVLLGAVLAWPRPDRTAAWKAAGWSGRGSRLTGEAHAGTHVLAIDDRSPYRRGLLEQIVAEDPSWLLRGKELSLSAWVRAAAYETLPVSLRLSDGETASEAVCLAGETWQHCAMNHVMSPRATRLRVVLAVGARGQPELTGLALFDDVVLRAVQSDEQPLPSSLAGNLLRNGSGESVMRLGAPLVRWMERTLDMPPDWLAAFADPQQVFSPAALARYGLWMALTFASFWANFGWLQVPLHPLWYVLLALLVVLALVGLARWGRMERKNRLAGRLLRFNLVAIGLILAQTFVPMLGRLWQPQGRYLLPALLPISLCLALGWHAWWPTISFLSRSLRGRWAYPWAVVTAGIAFNALCLATIAWTFHR